MARTAKILCLIGSLGVFLWGLQLLIRGFTVKSGPYYGAGRVLGNVSDFIGAVFLLVVTLIGLGATFNLPNKLKAAFTFLVLNVVLLSVVTYYVFTGSTTSLYEPSLPILNAWTTLNVCLFLAFLIAGILTYRQLKKTEYK